LAGRGQCESLDSRVWRISGQGVWLPPPETWCLASSPGARAPA